MRRSGALVALGACVAIGLGGCLVGFEDYPVGGVDGGVAAAGGTGTGASGGSWAGSSGSSGAGGTSAAGGAAGSGGSAGGAANGGSGGSSGSAASGGVGGSAASGGTSAGGAGGGTVDCKQYVWGILGGTCYAYGSAFAPTLSDCHSVAGQGGAIVTCDAECLLPNGGACQPMEEASKVALTDMCVVDDTTPSCTPFCSNTANYHEAVDAKCDSSGFCSVMKTNCQKFICNPNDFQCKTSCTSSADCVFANCVAPECV